MEDTDHTWRRNPNEKKKKNKTNTYTQLRESTIATRTG